MKNIKVCQIGDCDKKFYAKGYCKFHYKRWSYGRDLTAPNRNQIVQICCVEDCDQRASAYGRSYGYCGKHWWRLKDHGDMSPGRGRRPSGHSWVDERQRTSDGMWLITCSCDWSNETSTLKKAREIWKEHYTTAPWRCPCGEDNPDKRCASTYHCQKCYTFVKRYSDPERLKNQTRDSHLRKKYGITLEEYREQIEKQEGKCAICHRILANDDRDPPVDHNHETGAIRGILCHSCNGGLGLFKDNIETLFRAIEYLQNPPFSEDVSLRS